MEFILDYEAKVSISNKRRGNYNETIIEIEDSYNQLKTVLLKTIFKYDGIDTLKKCIDEDMFFELINENTDLLHSYLVKRGYIFSKA